MNLIPLFTFPKDTLDGRKSPRNDVKTPRKVDNKGHARTATKKSTVKKPSGGSKKK